MPDPCFENGLLAQYNIHIASQAQRAQPAHPHADLDRQPDDEQHPDGTGGGGTGEALGPGIELGSPVPPEEDEPEIREVSEAYRRAQSMWDALRTTPAALLTPPEGQTTLTGVPEEFEPEEIDRWMRGELVLTDEGLFNYWQQEWVICTDRIHYLETTLAGMTAPDPDDPEKPRANPKTIAAYTERLQTARAREQVIRERGVQIDPTGRVFNAKDYTENYADTHQPGQTTARSTLS